MRYCYIPGCKSDGDIKHAKISIFKICRPDLAKSLEEKKHRKILTDFILSVKSENDDAVKSLLHKES